MSTLGQYYIQVVPSADGIGEKLRQTIEPEAEKAGQSSGRSIMSGIGKTVVAGAAAIGTAVVGVSSAVVKGAADFASYGDNVDKMSQKMGLSSQAYQEWDAIMQHSGTSIQSMQASMKTLANAVERENGAFERLGLSMNDVRSMSNEDLFAATIAGLQNVENETERTYLAGQLLGRGATELGALLNTSAEDTEAMRQRVHELGGVLSEDAVKAAAAFQDNLQDMQTAFAGVKRSIAADFLPGLNSVMEGITGLVIGEEGAAESLAKGFDQILTAFSQTGGRLVEALGKILVPALELLGEVAPQMIEKVGEALGSAIKWIIEQLPAIITEGIPMLLSTVGSLGIDIAKALIDTAPELWNAGKELIAKLGEGLTETDLLTNGAEMISNLVEGMLSALPGMIATAGQIVTDFAGFIMDNLPVILEKGGDLIKSLISGIAKNLPQIATSAFQAITQFRMAIMERLPDLLSAGLRLIGEIAAGIIQAIPGLIASIPQVVGGIADTIMSHNWLEIGWNIISGIADGLLGMVGAVHGAAVSVCQQLLDALDISVDVATIWENIKTAIFEKWEAIKLVVSTAAENVWTVISEKFEAARAAVATAVDAVLTKITVTFNNIVTTVTKTAENVRSTIQKKFDEAKILIKNAVEEAQRQVTAKFQNMLNTVTEKATSIMNTARDKFNEMKNKIKEAVENALREVRTKFQDMLKAVQDKCKEIVDTARDKFNEVKDKVLEALGNLITSLPAKLGEIKQAFVDKFGEMAQDALKWGGDIVNGIADGISGAIGKVREAAGNVAGAIRGFLHFSEPDVGPLADFHTYMPDMIDLMVKGINEGLPKVREAISGLAMEVRPELDTSYMRGYSSQIRTPEASGFTQNLTINSPRELSPSESARLNKIAMQNTMLKMRMA